MKKYNQPIMELIPLAYGEVETLLTASSERGAEDTVVLSYDKILGGHYNRK